MENIVMNIAIQYAKARGLNKITDEAIKYAYEKLGMDQSNQNPEFTYGMPFTNNKVSINPMRMIANQGIKSLMGGSSMGMALPLMAGGLGLAYLRNPLRPGSMNYNPALKGQMDYLNFNNMMGSNPGTGLAQYGPNSVLAGKNIVSLFGTNDYEKQLDKKIDWFEKRIEKGKDINEDRYEQAKKEQADLNDYNVQKTIEKNQFKNLQNINAGGGGGGMQTSGFSNTDGGPVSNRTGRGRQGYGRGGIASL